MSPQYSKEDNERRLFELVGSVLNNTVAGSGSKATRESFRLRQRVARFVRRHPLVPASLTLCCAVWICLTNIRPESTHAVSSDSEPARTGSSGQPWTPHEGPSTAPVGAQDAGRPLSYWLDLLDDPDWRVRGEAAFELVKQSRTSGLVTPALSILLDDPHAGVRFWVVERFRSLGEHSERVRAAMEGFIGSTELRDLYESLDPRLRPAFETIIRAWLVDRDDRVRWTALTICEALGARAVVFTPSLETIREHDPQVYFRRQASATLRHLAPPGRRERRGRKRGKARRPSDAATRPGPP